MGKSIDNSSCHGDEQRTSCFKCLRDVLKLVTEQVKGSESLIQQDAFDLTYQAGQCICRMGCGLWGWWNAGESGQRSSNLLCMYPAAPASGRHSSASTDKAFCSGNPAVDNLSGYLCNVTPSQVGHMRCRSKV